jgi:protein-tyrosine phosphatase
VPLAPAEAAPTEIIEDHLLSYDRLARRFAELGFGDQLAAVTELLAGHDTTVEASLTATIAAPPMPDFLLDNGLSAAELAVLRARLTT